MESSWEEEEPEFVTNGNALLEALERCNFSLEDFTYPCHDVHTEYISLQKVSLEFDQERYHGFDEEMEKSVVCYLLGRTYRGPTLRVVISSPTWLEPICVGLTANPVDAIMSLHILFVGSDVRMGDSLQHIAPFVEQRSPSARGLDLHISSSDTEHILVGYGLYIAEAVRTNKLSMLDISNIAADPRETESEQIAEALIENTSIYHLMVQATSPILNSFVWEDSKAANYNVEVLTLVFVERVDFPELGAVLATNQKLQDIRLLNAHFSQSMWLRIISSLKANIVLEILDLGSSTGWIQKEVLSALLNRVRNCTQIIGLGLHNLPEDVRDNDILKEALPALNQQLRLNTEYGQRLRNAPSGPPRSARIVFCGPGYAGKTTFCKTMMRNESWLGSKMAKFLRIHKRPKVWRSLFGPHADKESHKRTKGVDMHLWYDQEDLRISLWDFAGQKKCYALHDYLFPKVNSANLFLLFFSLAPNPFHASGPNGDVSARFAVIERELLFWLRFLCSNSNAVIDPKPRVRVIITGEDRLDASKHAHASIHQWPINGILRNLKSQFWDRLDLVEPAMFVNARSVEMVSKVEDQIRRDFRYMVPKLEPTYAICEEVRRKLEEHTSSTPVIKVAEYEKICLQVDEKMLRSYHTRQAVASYLHNVGEIIYFKNLKFIVIDPRWLGVGVLGNLLGVFGRRAEAKSKGVISHSFRKIRMRRSCDRIYLENGFMNREGLRKLLLDSLQSVTRSTGIGPDDFIELLSALEICYKDDLRGGYLIPAALVDIEAKAARGIRELEWYTTAGNRPLDSTFLGRRLQCADQDRTILTPGFFPRLQVVLRKYLEEQTFVGEQGFGSFEIDRNLLRFMHNSMEIIIEYGEGDQYRSAFVDVLVRTGQDHKSTVDFIQKHVLDVTKRFCAQPEGNQGVTLVEGIIRPKSVEHLVLCKDRENHTILISVLEGYLKDDVSRRFFWNAAVPSCVNRPGIDDLGDPEEEYALDAINGKGFHDERRRNQTAKVEALSRKVDKLKKPLRIILESPIRQQVWLDTPKFVYILEDANVFPFSSSHGEVRLLLHLGCEQKDKPHVLTNQRGRPFVVEGEVRQTLMPLLQWAYKLLKLAEVAVAKSALFGALEVGVGMLPSHVPTSSPAYMEQKTPEKIGRRDREEIIRSYEEILRASPCCEWLIKFLDLQGKPEKFERDFSLRKVRYKDTQRIAFLCESCRIDGFARNVLQPP